jgi:hypothetical protein
MQFISYDQALTWSRLERIIFVCGAVFLVTCVDYLTSATVGYISLLAGLVGQLVVLKCWMDMFFLSKPFLNCWAFEG